MQHSEVDNQWRALARKSRRWPFLNSPVMGHTAYGEVTLGPGKLARFGAIFAVVLGATLFAGGCLAFQHIDIFVLGIITFVLFGGFGTVIVYFGFLSLLIFQFPKLEVILRRYVRVVLVESVSQKGENWNFVYEQF